MLRKFKISIDGTQYLVEMEEVGAPAGPAPVAAAPAPAPAAAPVPAPAPAPEPEPAPAPAASSAPAGAHVQAAAMPGKIVDIHVAVGDRVEVNQPVMVLEAMKMENEVVAEVAGTVASVAVAKGDMVNPGDELFSIA
ncbi:biotin/lipoyl-containing protein [Enorma phocaeensis]|uniref:biotin/lipoyl-containing protein n=2 Tax=Enorma phocaeensis TaxID=1871019 RepID=UPI0023560B65|nr:biotin/lipoyl-containing protein [Enorma phocaeensis]